MKIAIYIRGQREGHAKEDYSLEIQRKDLESLKVYLEPRRKKIALEFQI